MSSDGYIKLHRRVLDSWLWAMPEGQRVVALTLLMMANWKDGKTFSRGNVVEVKRGEVMTSIAALAKRARVSVKTVRTSLVNLEKAGFSASRSASNYRIISIANFDSYQSREDDTGKASGSTAARERQDSGNDRRREEGKKGRKQEEHTPPKPSAPPRFDFEAIYKIYPRKVGKKAGLAKLTKVIRTEADYTHLLDQVRKMADLWRAGDKTYCPHFSTFVNQERWMDDELPGPVRRDSRGRAEPPPPKLLRLLP